MTLGLGKMYECWDCQLYQFVQKMILSWHWLRYHQADEFTWEKSWKFDF